MTIVFPCGLECPFPFESETVSALKESGKIISFEKYQPFYFFESYESLTPKEIFETVNFYYYCEVGEKLSQLKLDLFYSFVASVLPSINFDEIPSSEIEWLLKERINSFLSSFDKRKFLKEIFAKAVLFLMLTIYSSPSFNRKMRMTLTSSEPNNLRLCPEAERELLENFQNLIPLIKYYDSNSKWEREGSISCPITFIVINSTFTNCEFDQTKMERRLIDVSSVLLSSITLQKHYLYEINLLSRFDFFTILSGLERTGAFPEILEKINALDFDFTLYVGDPPFVNLCRSFDSNDSLRILDVTEYIRLRKKKIFVLERETLTFSANRRSYRIECSRENQVTGFVDLRSGKIVE